MKFLAHRFLHAFLLLMAVSVMTFLLSQFAPGDYFSVSPLDPQVSPRTLSALRRAAGVDQPLFLRYASWLQRTVRGDFGTSLSYNSPVAGLVLARARNTLLLTGIAAMVAWVAALLLGVAVAAWPNSRFASLFDACMAVLLATPSLLLALAAVVVASRTGWFPAGGMQSVAAPAGWAGIVDVLWHLFLPAVVLALGYLPTLASHIRTAMTEALQSPFIEALRGLGVARRTLLFRYALKAAANPLITLLGISLGTLLSSSAIVEVVLGWPGLGPLLLEAVFARDFLLVNGAVLLSAALLIFGNLAADIALFAVDPRIRAV